jgi:hypothetical protein
MVRNLLFAYLIECGGVPDDVGLGRPQRLGPGVGQTSNAVAGDGTISDIQGRGGKKEVPEENRESTGMERCVTGTVHVRAQPGSRHLGRASVGVLLKMVG